MYLGMHISNLVHDGILKHRRTRTHPLSLSLVFSLSHSLSLSLFYCLSLRHLSGDAPFYLGIHISNLVRDGILASFQPIRDNNFYTQEERYTCLDIHIYIYICTYIYMYIYRHKYIYVYISICVYLYIYT